MKCHANLGFAVSNYILNDIKQSVSNCYRGWWCSGLRGSLYTVDTWKLDTVLEDARPMVDEGFRMYSTEGILVTEVPLTAKSEYGASRIVYHRMGFHDHLRKLHRRLLQLGCIPGG
jgi:hypothetical protein